MLIAGRVTDRTIMDGNETPGRLTAATLIDGRVSEGTVTEGNDSAGGADCRESDRPHRYGRQ